MRMWWNGHFGGSPRWRLRGAKIINSRNCDRKSTTNQLELKSNSPNWQFRKSPKSSRYVSPSTEILLEIIKSNMNPCNKYFSKGSYLEYPGGQPPGPPQFTKTRRGSPAFATAPAITVYTSVFSNNVYVRTRNILTNVRNSVILWIRKTKSCSPGRATALPITVYTSVPVTMITHKNTILFVTARLKKLRIRMVSDPHGI